MPRTAPLTARTIDTALDLKAAFHRLATADGKITADEEMIGMLIDSVVLKVERIDRARVIARNVEDNGGISDYAARMNREMDRDLGADVIRLDDYRREPQHTA